MSAAPEVVSLAAGARVPGRPFTDPGATLADLEALALIRSAQRKRLARGQGTGTWKGRDGAVHWLVAPAPARLLEAEPCLAVGFFGQAREDVDHTTLVELEHAMLERPEELPGLLSYHNVRLADGQWGNLVLFEGDADTALLRSEPHHADAIARTPAHYHSLRLHRGLLPDGPLGRREVELRTTLYLDFADAPPWRAVRSA